MFHETQESDIMIKQKINFQYLLVFSVLVGSFLRFYKIGVVPLWIDEACSYWFSGRTILELWTIVPKFETNPPLYYTILKIWESLFGSSEACLRSLSAVMSIGCIPLVFILGKLIGKPAGGGWLGAIAALMFSVSPVHIRYAQEARPYAMLTFATTLTLCTFLWIMRHPSEACEPILRNPFDPKQNSTNGSGWSKYLPWMTAIIAIAFTLWSHNTSILYIVTLFMIMLTWFIVELRFNRNFLVNMIVSALIIFLLWGPYLIFLIHQAASASLPIPKPTALYTIDTVSWLLFGTSISWTTVLYELKKVAWLLLGHSVPETTVLYKLKTVAWFLHGQSTSIVNDFLKIGAFAVLIALATAGLLNIWRRSGKYISLLILGSIVGPILMELLFSFALRPIFLARTLIYVSVPFYIAVAAGIMTLRDSRKRAIVIIIISFFFLKSTSTYYKSYQKDLWEPWDKIAQFVAQQAKDDVVLLVPNNLEIPFSYYAKRISNKNLQIVPLPFPISNFLHPTFDLDRFGFDSFKAIQMRPSDIPTINNAIAKKSPVWFITRTENLENLFDHERIVSNFLIQKRNLIAKWRFGDINIFKFN